jgi:hypothetical protein
VFWIQNSLKLFLARDSLVGKIPRFCSEKVILVRLPERARDFSVFQEIQTDPEVHLVVFPNGTAVAEIKRSGSEDDCLLSSSAKNKNDWSCISTTVF